MQRITRIASIATNKTRIANRAQLLQIHRRRVSQQCFDVFGFVKDGTDLVKRDSVSWIFWYMPYTWRIGLVFVQFGPMSFVLWTNGVFDYLFRRRTIKPLEPDWTAEYPYRPKDPNYENPLFEPARKHAAKLAKKKAEEERIAAELAAKTSS